MDYFPFLRSEDSVPPGWLNYHEGGIDSEGRVAQIDSQLKRRIRERLEQDTALFGELAG